MAKISAQTIKKFNNHEEGKGNESENEDAQSNSSQTSPEVRGNVQSQNEMGMPELQALSTTFFRKEVIIEAAFRYEDFTTTQNIEILHYFYGNLCQMSPKERKHLVKIIWVYKRLDLVDAIFNNLYNKEYDNHVWEAVPVDLSGITQHPDPRYTYTHEDFIIDLLKCSIKIDYLNFTVNVYQKYHNWVDKKSMEIVTCVIYSLLSQYQTNKLITYPFDKFQLIDSVCENFVAETPVVHKLVKVITKLLKMPPHVNFIANSHNPIRLMVLIIKVFRAMDKTVGSIKEELVLITQQIESLAFKLIDHTEEGVVKNWLFDDMSGGLKVIDYLSHHKLMRLLSHNKITKTAQHIWIGNYDWEKYSSLMIPFQSSHADLSSNEYNISLESSMTILGPKKWG